MLSAARQANKRFLLPTCQAKPLAAEPHGKRGRGEKETVLWGCRGLAPCRNFMGGSAIHEKVVWLFSGSNRVKRGGNWNNNNAQNCRSANRNNNTPSNRNNNDGFRVAVRPSAQWTKGSSDRQSTCSPRVILGDEHGEGPSVLVAECERDEGG